MSMTLQKVMEIVGTGKENGDYHSVHCLALKQVRDVKTTLGYRRSYEGLIIKGSALKWIFGPDWDPAAVLTLEHITRKGHVTKQMEAAAS